MNSIMMLRKTYGAKKIVEVEGIVKVETKVMDTQSREILVDAYSLSRELEILEEQIELKENVGMNRANVLVRETLDIPRQFFYCRSVFYQRQTYSGGLQCDYRQGRDRGNFGGNCYIQGNGGAQTSV